MTCSSVTANVIKKNNAGSRNWVRENMITSAEYHVCATMFDLRGKHNNKLHKQCVVSCVDFHISALWHFLTHQTFDNRPEQSLS